MNDRGAPRAPLGRSLKLWQSAKSRRWQARFRTALSAVVAALMVAFGLTLVAPPASAAGTTFSSTWDTTKTSTGSSGSNQIKLPLIATGNYNFVVDWGDGSTNTITSWNQAETTHTYASSGVKNLSIAGTIKGWQFANVGDKLKITDISAWGPLQLGNDGAYFWGAANLNLTATDGPDLSATNNLSNMFLNASKLNADLSSWDVSGVTNLNGAFRGAVMFNGNISNWNVSAVTTMNGTFRGATAFNSDISGWNVGAVTNMSSMFNAAPAFDRNLAAWNVTNVSDMASMFASAGVSRANYDSLLIGWASQAVKANVEFNAGSSKYTQGPASAAHTTLTANRGWDITDGGVTSAPAAPTSVQTTRADTGATATWNESAPNNSPVLEYVATIAPAPNSGSATCSVTPPAARSCTWANLNNGQTYTITVTARNVIGTSAPSTPVTVIPEVDTPNAPVVNEFSALALDGKASVTWSPASGGGTPITYTATSTPGNFTCQATAPALTCDVLGLTNGTDYTFKVTATNPGGTSPASAASNEVTPGPVFATTWDTTKVDAGGSGSQQIRLPLVADGTYDFVVGWGDGTFSNIVTRDVDPGNLSGITHSYATGGIKNLTITGTIKGWNFQNGIAGNKERLKISNVSSWGSVQLGTPTKQGEFFKGTTNMAVSATDALDMTGTTSLAGAFQDATSFNGAIGNWNVSAVTNMNHMFAGATSFNQPLAAWAPANVTSMAHMFAGATSFNQPLSGWGNLLDVTTTAAMFDNADAFNSALAWTSLPDLTTTEGMFANADAFNQALNWPVSQPNLTNTANMFNNADAFNNNVATLDMSDVTNASGMFQDAAAFNQPLATWNFGTINLTDMFKNATSFNQDLSGWNFAGVTRFGQFLNNSALANLNQASGIYNYNQLLLKLASQNVVPNTGGGSTTADRTIDSSPAKYSVGLPASARDTLIGRGFVITDGGQTNMDVPDAPENVAGDTGVNPPTISWSAPNDHNSAITGYTVTATHRTAPLTYPAVQCQSATTSCTFSSALPDAANNYNYSVTATNAVGTSAPSASEAPGTPSQPVAVAGDAKATVSITPPTVGAAPTTYTITSTPESKTCTITVPAVSCDVTGLTNGVSYTFTAVATNWVGSSAASAPSAAVIPGKVLATTWRTNNTSAGSSEANQIKLPLTSTGTYDFYAAWGDGTTSHITSYNQPEVTHTYALAGTKNVTITGTINGWRFNATGDRLKLLGISTWGPLQLGNAGGYFYGASNLAVTATDSFDLAGTTNFFNAFYDASSFNADVTGWDVDQVTDMTNAFKGTTAFQGTGLSSWTVSGVQQMDSMFESSGINVNIGGWTTAAVVDMNRMFAGAPNFNQDIGAWNTAAVEDMAGMFSGAGAFNQDLSSWQTGAVEDMSGMFEGSAIDASRSVAGWDIRRVTNFTNMFRNNPGLAMPGSVGWYNELLLGWAPQITASGAVTLTVCGAADSTGAACASGAPQYSAGAPENARLTLIDHGWTVIDGGLSELAAPDQIVDVVTQDNSGSAVVAWQTPNDNGSQIQYYTISAVEKADRNNITECATVTWPDVIGACPQDPDDYLFSVTATNGVGTSVPSSIDVPGVNAPVVQPAGSGALLVAIDPATTGGTPQSYQIKNAGGGPNVCEFDVPTQSCVVTGLTNGTEYSFIAIASNWLGDSGDSAPSVPVAPTNNVFTSTWDTTNTSAGSSTSATIDLPLTGDGTYSFTVNWGDGTSGIVTSAADADASHTYSTRGIKNIAITGGIEGFSFDGAGDRLKLTDISNWGPLQLGNSGGYFSGAANFNLSATSPLNLAGTTNFSDAFAGATSFNGDVSDWDVSAVTDMSGMFSGSGFTGDISGWDTGNVELMGGMFAGTEFNGDISGWDTGSLTDLNNTFKSSAFTGDITGWDITGVTNFSGLFQDISTMTGPSYINWYNALLSAWAAQPIPARSPTSVPFTACGAVDSATDCPAGLQYYGTPAADARSVLVDKGWAIADGGVAEANVPDAPTEISVARSGTQATVSWTAPADNGSPITGYQVTTDPGAITCDTATTECVVNGLDPDESVKYSFTVTATNSIGTSPASAPYPMLRPGVPGTPVAVVGDASATVTVEGSTTGGPVAEYVVTSSTDNKSCTITLPASPLTCQVNGLTNGVTYTFTAVAKNDGGASGASTASNSVTPLAPAREPEFGAPTATADGFTVQITNYDAAFTWAGTATNATGVEVSNTGLVTVTGVAPDTESVATITTSAYGFVGGSEDIMGRSLKAGLVPTFTLPVTPTENGFTVQVSNYSGLYGWTGQSTADGQVAVSDTGLVTVTNVAPDTLAQVVITTTREGYADATAPVEGTSLKAKVVPSFGDPTPTANGFTVQVTNFDSGDGFTWAATSSTPDGSTPALDQGSGLVTVTNVAPNTATTVTITTTQAGFATGSATASSKSLNAPRNPTFGDVTSTADGYTVPITNYGSGGDGFDWNIATVTPGSANADLDDATGVITVTGLAASATATVTVTTTKEDFVGGSSEVEGEALAAAGTPVLGTVTQNPTGFTVPITNYYTDNNNTNYEWSVDTLTLPAVATIVPENPAFVSVTGLTPGQSVQITVRTTREGYAPGEAQKTGSALEAARTPTFDTPTRTATGYTVQISNYGTAGDGFDWTIASVDPNTATPSLDATSGLITVTSVAPAAQARITVQTTKTGYVTGSAEVAASALDAPLNPSFADPDPTEDGYTVQITNYSAAFTWNGSATNTSTPVSISGTGLVTVAGVAPGTLSELTVTTTQEGWVDGSGSTSGTSITGAVRTPAFGSVTRTSDGFTVPITNYGTNGDGYTWTPTVDPNTGSASIDSATGLLTVSGFAEGTDVTATVATSRTGYASGSAEVEGRSLDPQLTPTFGTPNSTQVGFTVQISNYDASFTWDGTATNTSTPVTISNTGLVTVAGVAPGTESTVTVTANKVDHVQGSASVAASSINGDAFEPAFGTVTRTSGGFTVPITNYDSNYSWGLSVTNSGSATVDGAGLVTVIGLADGVTATLTVDVTRTGYDPGSGTINGTALEAAHNPTFGAPTATATGFTVQITNYDDSFVWDASATSSGVVGISETGFVTVSNVAPGTEATLTVTTNKEFYNQGTGSVTQRSINGPALTPVFGAATRTAGGFTVQVSNYVGANYTWTASATNGGQASVSDSGLVTVTGLADGAVSTVTVTVERTGYDTGTNSIGEQALEAALTPGFGTATPTATGYTVQISNYDATYSWSGTATATSTPVTISGSGLVTVAGVAAGTNSTVTVTTMKANHIQGSAQTTAKSLEAALTPAFGTPTRTADGYTVAITNFAADDAFTWSIGSATAGVADLDQSSGVVTVTTLAAGTPSTVTVTTSREDYVGGSAPVTASALNAALTPIFATPTPTATGFTVAITNYSGSYDWAGSATATTTAVTISNTGLVTVAGVAPETESTLTVTTTREGYVGGTASVTDSSLKAALTPTFTTPTSSLDGFSVVVTNYNPDFEWTASATNTEFQPSVAVDGTISVTGVSPGTTSVVTVTTTQPGFADGTATVSGTAVEGAPLTPVFGTVVRTAVGFDVQIINYRSGFTWAATGAGVTASVSSTGYLTVSGLAPNAVATVTVTASRTGYLTGSAPVIGAANPQAVSAPPATAPARVTITSIKVTQKKNNKSSAKVYFTPGSNGGAPLLGSKLACKIKGSKTTVKASGSSTSVLTVKKLQNKKTYVCTAAVYNALGAGVPSASKSFKVKG